MNKFNLLNNINLNDISNFTKYINNKLYCSIRTNEYVSSFIGLNKYLFNLDKKQYIKYREITRNKCYYCLVPFISYIIKLDKSNFIIVKTNRVKIEQRMVTEIEIRIYGIDRFKIRTDIFKKIIRNKSNKFIEIYESVNYEDMRVFKTLTVPFNNIILDESCYNRIINTLNIWKGSEKFYKNNNLIYKIGILLYGKPGTGKSFLAKGISNYFDNAPIFKLDLTMISTNIINLQKLRNNIIGTIIVLIEDIDLLITNREDNENNYYVNNKNENMNILFQLLDGIYSMNNIIFIATTNNIEKLDEALIRNGRFDLKEELKYFNYEEAIKYISSFDNLNINPDNILKSFNLEFPVQPSYLRSKILEYINTQVDTSL